MKHVLLMITLAGANGDMPIIVPPDRDYVFETREQCDNQIATIEKIPVLRSTYKIYKKYCLEAEDK